MVTLNHACGRNANHAAMPALAVDHDAVGLAQSGIAVDAIVDCAQDSAFLFLALGVEPVKFAGQSPGARDILFAEQIDHSASYIHASGSIDAGSDAERNFGGAERAV